jgi:hypothetical protein
MKADFSLVGDTSWGTSPVMSLNEINFREQFKGDCLASRNELSAVISLTGLVSVLREVVHSVISEGLECSYVDRANVMLHNSRVCIHLTDNTAAAKEAWEEARRDLVVATWGDETLLRRISEKVRSFRKIKSPRITWNYLVKGSRQEATVFVDEPRPTPDSFYPWLDNGLNAYIDDYVEHPASILLLRGEPGTGKTTFIQNLIWRSNLNTYITYEDALFQSDELFVNFMTDDQVNLLIMEDADLMLKSRERDGNALMAKFLNVADGLIRFPKKKIIISSNIVDERDIDPALLRPGRCYDTPVFRKLTHAESKEVAQDVALEAPEAERDYTLAEVLVGPRKRVADTQVGFLRARAA